MRVLVTRPEPGASKTVARLDAMGYRPLAVPLTRVAPVPASLARQTFGSVAASSANAIRLAGPEVLRPLAGLPFFAVGRETADQARRAGFRDIAGSAGSASALAETIRSSADPSRPLAYLCGRVRLASLESDLAAAGFKVEAIETYDTLPRSPSSAELAAIEEAPIDAALVYSAASAEALGALAQNRMGTIFRKTVYVAISGRVAAVLGSFAGDMVTAPAASEDSMLECLEAALRSRGLATG